MLLSAGLVPALTPSASAAVGQGFNLNTSDLRFILQQIKISEQHVANPATTASNPCGALLGNGPNQIPNANGQGVLLPFGLRTVDGTCNNLITSQTNFGAADQSFPRMLTADYKTPYAPSGGVSDPEARRISNLIVDQTATNPAAVDAAGSDPEIDGGTLVIPNVAPDVGLSAPYNSWFTIFGQFFDHGLDLVGKAGSTVFVPLQSDDPLFVPGSPTNFMVLTRAAGGGSGANSTSSFIDQSQTYTSHPSHQAFLREYAGAPGAALATGRMLTGGAEGGLATWADTKAQSASLLGIKLEDRDVSNLPLLATDPYGRFLRGPNGFAQLVVPTAPNGLLEGVPGGVTIPSNATRTGHAFLDDIAHNAAPTGTKTPDADSVVNGPAPLPAGVYDNEMLDRHFVAGDGRVNENIALTAVHHVFHSEHNRLAEDGTPGATTNKTIKQVLATDPALQADWNNAPFGTGERLFQAAKFVTEMQYQHLAFEEFARKVQPQINLFGSYDSSINPAITAEFAHVVYRFGHSMLTETVARRTPAGSDAPSLPLLDAFLDPVKYDNDGALSPEAAAGQIVRGMTRQVGNELDEFVSEALRNKLLGLPLDLATLNLVRGRETGVPRLNEARRQLFNRTNEPALQPYSSWADFGFAIRHPKSLVNFVAAYGLHGTITSATTSAAKRAAADLLINGDPGSSARPLDADSFLNSTGTWATAATGLNNVDFWIGGLAEKQQPFGGLLGSTFNYVFETQMENLQDGDRLYYLGRTAGLNMLTQLEGNSFAELISRNTDATGLPADSFARPDFILNVQALLANPTGIADDPTTEDVNEADRLVAPGKFLTRTGSTLRYSGPEHVVFNGTVNNDSVISSEGDDTLRGDDANDRLEGGAGNDSFIGGDGDDILTDNFGDDVLKGGDGNDALSSGQGFDLNQAGRGNDFVVGGSDPTETFAGPGDDKVIAGGSADTVFGDDGDDWIEGGGQNDLLQGDNGAPFQDDPNEPGHDVIKGDGGNDDYDAEGGDDIMVAGPGIERNEGMLGFDWVTHKSDPQASNADLNFTGLLPDTLDTLRDRFDLTESLSGWNLDDTLRGDSRLAADMVGHELGSARDPNGVDRVAGLQALLRGARTFTNGNIILGGAGSDLLEGRGGNDIIDGDSWLDVQLQTPGGTFDSMSQLQAAVQAGTLNPGAITIVRSIKKAAPGADLDTAVFSGPRSEYTFTPNADSMVVTHTGGTQADGVDRVDNIERLTFADGTVEITNIPGNTPAAGTVTISDTTPTVGQALTATTAITDPDGLGTITLNWQQETSPNVWVTVATTTGAGSAFVPQAAQANLRLRVIASFTDGDGVLESVTSAATSPVAAVVTAPAAPTAVTFAPGNTTATVSWTAPAGTVTSYQVQVRIGLTQVGGLRASTGTSTVVTGLTNGTTYNFRVRALNGTVAGAYSAAVNGVPGTPSAPTAVVAQTAVAGGPITVGVNWQPPVTTNGSAITGYQVQVLNGAGTAVLRTATVGAAVRTFTATSPTPTLTNGTTYRMRVSAINARGAGTAVTVTAVAR